MQKELPKISKYKLIAMPIAYFLVCTLSFFVYMRYMYGQQNLIICLWLIFAVAVPTALYAYANIALLWCNVLFGKGNKILHILESLIYIFVPMFLVFLTVPYLLNMF